MSFISDIFSSTVGSTISAIGDTVKKFVTTDGDRIKMQLELESLLQRRDSEVENTIRKELEGKEKILVAELTQGDNYTKRARPTLVYFGLVVIMYNYCIIPTIQMYFMNEVSPFILPTEFWLGWSGVVATWSIGRTAEKRGSRSKVTSFITGS